MRAERSWNLEIPALPFKPLGVLCVSNEHSLGKAKGHLCDWTDGFARKIKLFVLTLRCWTFDGRSRTNENLN